MGGLSLKLVICDPRQQNGQTSLDMSTVRIGHSPLTGAPKVH